MYSSLPEKFARVVPSVDFCSLRAVTSRSEELSVRQDIVQPPQAVEDSGVMISVHHEGGTGYAGTSDVSESGLRAAVDQAMSWAARSAGRSVTDYSKVEMPSPQAEYRTPVAKPWDSTSLGDKLDLLRQASASMKIDARIVDWEASLWNTEVESLYLTAEGGRAHQRFSLLVPDMRIVANEGTETERRTLGGRGHCRQGGLEILDGLNFGQVGPILAKEALELLDAEGCPEGDLDLVLYPDQMILQIHESIGHPLELDRILGDERNYAGTSFVTLDMFGSYRYGSELLNITYDPSRRGEFASYAVDDEGQEASRKYIIKDGLLERPLGGVVSQARAGGIDGVANARATSWNRPAIDRMANLNLEAGTLTEEELISQVEFGVAMKTNCSWSIDDSRNKFQFGCEYGRLIENGELSRVVRKPNYRGISATFWRALKGVGDESTVEVLGSPFCGKGEPNQVIRVGHASPLCLFDRVSIFGGA